MPAYIGRFAPTPSGPLHAGSLVAALASWLDARAHAGRWLVRIEDLDGPRTAPGAEQEILRQLQALGLVPDAPPLRQSTRGAHYARALQALRDAGHAYPCGCTKREIETELAALGRPSQRGAELVYPGTCRNGLQGRPARAWRLRCGENVHIAWGDRRLGPQQQDVTRAVGDFVLQRADGPWAYQLAVVVDDAEQGITDIVRGADLLDSTPRQIYLQRLLGLPLPHYAHLPVAANAQGEKLSKQTLAQPLDAARPLPSLIAALRFLGQQVPGELAHGDAAALWKWAVTNWDAARVPRCRSIRI
jgi:glutamyl-Q tRNA(Asp) synthetase